MLKRYLYRLRGLGITLGSGLPVVAGILLLAGSMSDSSVNAQEEGQSKQQDWRLLPIPDSWKQVPGKNRKALDGYGWYRCFVKIPEDWKDQKLELFVEPVDDARATYINGTKVGAAGTFPPQYRSGLGETGRYSVPSELINYGGYNVVAVRTFYNDGRSNFSVAAPALLAGQEAIKMEGQWQYRPGDDKSWSKLPKNPQPDEKIVYTKVDQVDNVERYLKRRKGDHNPYPPQEALEQFEIADDLRLEQPLSEPEVRQPLYMNFDERGRLWVLQYLQYPNPAGIKAISRDKHLRTVYDKMPEAPPNHVRGHDKITIHEDTDGDGIYDKHKTFIDGLNIATSFAKGRGGLWVLNPPYLLFYPDLDNDDVPDSDPVVHLEGFGLEDTHSVVNSLRWGPDGWLYAAQGSTVTAQVKRPGLDKEAIHSMGQLIWRYHPESRRYEIFAEGGGNTFGVEVDSKGRVYSGTNGGNSRGYHYVQGGFFRKAFSKHGSLSNPYAFGYFPDMEHHTVPRFTHNFIIYEGNTLPEQYQGKLFGIEPLQGQIVQSELTRHGSTFRSKDLNRPIKTDDQWFRPVDIKAGPDGAIYIADFYEQRIDHSSHYAGRIDRSNGRIYRLTNKNPKRPEPFNLAKLSSPELIDVLKSENKWFRQEALRIFGDRKDASIIPQLKQIIEKNTGQLALEALWALNLSGGFTEPQALKMLDHENPYVRQWTVRLLADPKDVSPKVADKLAELALREAYVDTRSQLACSAKRLPAEDGLPIVRNLLTHDEDIDDPHIPLLLWWAVESKAASDREAVLDLFSDETVWRLPIVDQHIIERLMRRYAMAGSRKDLLTAAKLLELAPGKKQSKKLMAGFEKAYKGRSLANLPQELVDAIAKVGGGSPALRLRQGDAEVLDDALKAVGNEQADKETRLEFVQIFGEIQQPEAVPVLLELVEQSNDNELRNAALTALQSYQNPQIPQQVIEIFGQLPEEVRDTALTLLASRRSWAQALLQAVDQERVDKKTIPMTAIRKVLLHDDETIASLVEKHWGSVQGATTEEMRARIEQLFQIIEEASGNPYKGRDLFMKQCGKCHTLFKQGGEIGPNLTSYKRDDLQRMLLNIVNPSAEIREGFENFLVVTNDGRVVNGFLADEDNRVVILRGVDGQNLVIPREEILEMRALSRSVMPDGTLKELSNQQIRDLFAYLRSSQPLP